MGVTDPGGVWEGFRVRRSKVPVEPTVVINSVGTQIPVKDNRPLAVRSKASAWVALVIFVVAATMMHPTFASLIAEALIGVLLFLMRWLAHIEGRHGS